MSESGGPAANDWGLPFGQMVESEAFNLEHSISLTENLERLTSLTHKIDALAVILSDQTRPESQRVRDALRTIHQEAQEALQTSLACIEEEKREKLVDLPECSEEVVEEPTIKIDLASQEDLQSEGEGEITNSSEGCPKQQQNNILSEDVGHLRSLLRTREQEVVRLKRERGEAEGQLRRQVAELSRRLQVSEQKLAGCSCKLERGQEMSKMNKWMQTLNKLLYGAQKQAAISRDELKRSGQLSAKHLKEKDEQIKQLEAELQAQRNTFKTQFQS